MKHTTTYVAAALAAVLAMGTTAGCGATPASSSGASAASTAAVMSQDEIIAELKSAVSKEPTYKSVTLTENSSAIVKTESEEGEPEAIEATTVYKYDASGDKLKTFMEAQIDDVKLQYYSDGDEAVCVTDGPVYSGTTEQFDSEHFKGAQAYLTDTFGDLNKIVDCIDNVSKEQKDDVVEYKLVLNTDKYIASDEILSMMAEYGDPVKKAIYVLDFDKDGRMVQIDQMTEYESTTSNKKVALSDFDTTVIDPMPKADKTFEEMEADKDAKLDAFMNELEESGEAETEAEAASSSSSSSFSSSDATE